MNIHSLHFNGLFVDDFVYLHVGLAQGAGNSSYWYCFLPKALLAILIRHHPDLFYDDKISKVCSFMDDCFGGSNDIDKTWQQFLVFLLIATLLGIDINWKKVKLPGTFQKILGIMLDFAKRECSINPKKLQKFKVQVKELLKTWKISLKSLQKVTGKMIFFAICCPILPTLLANLLTGISIMCKNGEFFLNVKENKKFIRNFTVTRIA